MPHPANSRLNAIRMVRGQTKKLQLSVKTREGRPARLAEAKLYMSVSRGVGEDVVLRKQTGDGIDVTDPVKGVASIVLSSDDTFQLASGTYRYDVWVEFPGTPPERYPVVQFAQIEVLDSVTEFSG